MNIEPITELISRSQDHLELRRFHTFHQRHPEVLDFLVTEIRLLIAHGRTAFSFHSLWQYARWKLEMRAAPGEAFAMNDHTAPYYARAIVILHPEFNGLAEFRESTPDKVFGTRVEPLTPDASEAPRGRRRKLQWSDGTPLERGWRPTTPHVAVTPGNRRPNIHAEVSR